MGALDDSAAHGGKRGDERNQNPSVPVTLRKSAVAGSLLLLLVLIVLPPLFAWQSENAQKALSLSNMRRVANGCLYYAQDWDLRMPPPTQQTPDGFRLGWSRLVRPYVLLDEAFSNPSNPVKPFQSVLRDPIDGRPIDTSYAMNRRFWSPSGPFPVGNLEIPEQTALLVEAGRMAADPRNPHLAAPLKPGIALDLYGDTEDRVQGLSPYPSTHGGQLGVVAADGHAITIRVLYYGPLDGRHDKALGRLGEGIYNWNGGHPNGQTDTPAVE